MLKVSVLGGSGYAGGELLRLLLNHPNSEVVAVTSQRYAGEPVHAVHPNLRGHTDLKFEHTLKGLANESDTIFTALPHGQSSHIIPDLVEKGIRVVDLAADFRLKDPAQYREYYGIAHEHPDVLQRSVYGLPELHREEVRGARLVSVPGCIATAAILGLAPLIRSSLVDTDRLVVDAKVGSSGAGAGPSVSSHHSEREGGVRPYKTVGHRHTAEIEQELGQLTKDKVSVSLSPHAVGMVRGILATSHTFPNGSTEISKKDVWKAYRASYQAEPFVRIVSDNKGPHGLPNPKMVVGTNLCDVGFDLDPRTRRVVAFSALDNLTKGAAGQAVQCWNIMTGVEERTGLVSLGLHP